SVLVAFVGLVQWLSQHGPHTAYVIFSSILKIVNGILAPTGLVDFLLPSSTGARLDSTIGNPGYVGGYLLFGMFFTLILLFRRKNWYLRGLYGVALVLQLLILIQTQTRGAYLGLIAGAGLLLPYFIYLGLRAILGHQQPSAIGQKAHRQSIIGAALITVALGVVVLGAGLAVYQNRNADFVRMNPALSRLTSISLSEATAKNRLLVWGIALEAIKQKPILGWGYENFQYPFNYFFNPELREPWFDRSHNLIIDRLITGGVIGLLVYLSFLLAPIIMMWRGYYQRREALNDRYLALPIIITVTLLAYGIQNMFIFEALVTYIPLIVLLSFAAALSGRSYEPKLPVVSPALLPVIGGIVAVVVIGVAYVVTVRPLMANRMFIAALGGQQLTMEGRRQMVEVAISRHTYGRSEFRQQAYQFFYTVAAQGQIPQAQLGNWLEFIERELKTDSAENPQNARAYLSLMSFYTVTSSNRPERLQRVVELQQQLQGLTPNRPEAYFDLGYAQLSLSALATSTEIRQGHTDAALVAFQKAYNLNKSRPDSYQHLLYGTVYLGRTEEVRALLAQRPVFLDDEPAAALLVTLQGVATKQFQTSTATLLKGFHFATSTR
ncbi:MAG: O-antigen ligase family protein, partial [Candidatus Buchananbacteria bacterium]|nr:O-antigen ligase family protein [Candidatus Buchananbacteria bacterium]